MIKTENNTQYKKLDVDTSMTAEEFIAMMLKEGERIKVEAEITYEDGVYAVMNKMTIFNIVMDNITMNAEIKNLKTQITNDRAIIEGLKRELLKLGGGE